MRNMLYLMIVYSTSKYGWKSHSPQPELTPFCLVRQAIGVKKQEVTRA